MKILLTILGTLIVAVILYHAVVGVACLYMTTPIVTQEPTREDIRNYIKSVNPQFTVDESEMR
jgi:hypothetical protein